MAHINMNNSDNRLDNLHQCDEFEARAMMMSFKGTYLFVVTTNRVYNFKIFGMKLKTFTYVVRVGAMLNHMCAHTTPT